MAEHVATVAAAAAAILQRFNGRPVAIEPMRGEAFFAALASDSPAAFFMDDGDDREPYSVENGVAVVDIAGVLVNGKASFVDRYFGLVGYDDIAESFRQALSDPRVSAIVLRVDSPGGDAVGGSELAQEIFAARGTKPIVAVAVGMMASAAYHVASAADVVYTMTSAMVGSIGTWTAHVDRTGLVASMGMKVSLIHAGARKVDTSPYRPLDGEAHASLKATVDALYDVFTADVARHRGMDQGTVKGTEARIYVGGYAVSAKLADGVRSFGAVMRELAVKPASNTPRASAGDPKKETKPMADPVSTLNAISDAERAELDELRAAKKADEIAASTRTKQERESVINRHAKRLSPSTLMSLRADLEKLSPEKVDGLLSKVPDEVTPEPVGQGGGAVSSQPGAAGKKYASAQDELIDRATAYQADRRERGVPCALSQAMVTVLREDADLNQRVTTERKSEVLPSVKQKS